MVLIFLSAQGRADVTRTMGVDDLTRGMRGIGRTVFHGTQIDSFHVEILGVLHSAFGPKSDMILARLSGAPLEKTGGIAGMSGSPVYIDGNLIGAVAYGWSFSIEPIMGITPISEMLDILDRPDVIFSSQVEDLVYPYPSQVTEESISQDVLTGLEAGQMNPVRTPVYLSGFSSAILPRLRDRLASFGLMPVQGGGGLDASLPEATLEPGSALGVQLVRGDFNMTAIGTLTHIDGNRLVGFGHSMFLSGSTRLPMTTAFIHDIIASQFQSIKLGSAVKQVGAITQDRASGIGGVIGEKADMMPIDITVRSVGRIQNYKIEVLKNRDLGPVLIQSAVVSSLISAEKARGDVTVRTSLKMKVRGRPDVAFENVFAGARGLGEGVLGVTRPMQLLLQNPFERVEVETASFELEVAENVKAALIESITLDRSRFKPGDDVGIELRLRPYLSESTTLKTSVVIPRHIRKGVLTLRASSARSHSGQESKRIPGEYRVSDVDGLIRMLERQHRNDELIVELLANRAGATVGGREMSSLPPSVIGAIRGSRKSDSVRPVSQSVVANSILETPYVLAGQQTVFISVGLDGSGLRFGSGQTGNTQKKK
ncbi:MAG: SpoIVB peptidase S55 domain-containing protein [Candidatus Latescibacterota bacterium]|nr:SpoIVB peptidase S55 domain-containing protein [Candidatus Latescibacterota bacterium]